MTRTSPASHNARSFSPCRISADVAASAPSVATRLSDDADHLRPRVTEIDEGRDGVVGLLREGSGGRATGTGGRGAEVGGLVLELGDDAGRKLGADALSLRHGRLVLARDGEGEVVWRQHAEDRERHLRADALHALEQAEPVSLAGRAEAEEADRVLSHLGLDRERHGLAAARQLGERARRAIDHVADAADVDDRPVGTLVVDEPRELADHRATVRASAASRRGGRR